MSDPKPFDMPPPSASFEARGGWVLNRLVADLGITPIQAAGIVGNLGGESGLQAINEKRPMVPGSRGGFGWAQWTASRRVLFEAYARARGLRPTDDQANYEFLLVELKGRESPALRQLKKQTQVETATDAFLRGFERPSDPDGALPGRIRFAYRALAGADATGDPPHPLPPLISRTAAAREMQATLANLGLYKAKIDGAWGPLSRAAYAAFLEG